MSYFTLKQGNLFPFYDLSTKDKEFLNWYLNILESSNVGKIIFNSLNKTVKQKGRPSYNPYLFFAAILLGFTKRSSSLRSIQEYMTYDLRFLYITEMNSPSYATIGDFLNNVVVKDFKNIFYSLTSTILKKCNVVIDDLYIDGTKIEANSNKYKFVRKPTKFHVKLDINIRSVLEKYFKLNFSKKFITSKEIGEYITKLKLRLPKESIIFSKVDLRGKKVSEIEKDYLKLEKYLIKTLEYEEKEELCTFRNSYYKTDADATAMALKSDYYSGLGSSMHAAYNYQIAVSKGFIIDFYVSQNISDTKTLIPFLEQINKGYGFYPKNLCCDAGYGSLENYCFLSKNNIGNYIKYNYFKKEVNGEYVSLLHRKADGKVYCLNNKVGEKTKIVNKFGEIIESNNRYTFKSCKKCKLKEYCLKFCKDKNQKERTIIYNEELQQYRQQAKINLLSPKGIEMRVNRSSQVEGVFGIIKQDMDYTRARRRGLENVSLEFGLICLGYNLRKLFTLFDNNLKINYWTAPSDLKKEETKNVNLKKLMKIRKKGLNEKIRRKKAK